MNGPHATRRATHPVSAALASVIAISAATPWSVTAAPTLVFADTTYEAHAEIVHPGVNTYRSDPPTAVLAATDTTEVEAFVTAVQSGPNWGFGGAANGTPTNHPDEAFASARKRGAGVIDLGASGRSEGPGADNFGRITAEMTYTGRVTNTGTYGVAPLSYTIPLIEIATANNRFNGLVAEVDVDYFFGLYDLNDSLIFDFSRRYTLTYDYFKPPTTSAIQTFTASPDLLNDGGPLVDVTACFLAATCGRAVGPFTIEREYVLDTGDYLKWEIYVSVYQVTGGEGGGHALFGDPLAIAGGAALLRPSLAVSTAVPVPASWALLGVGFAALALVRRRRLRNP